MHIDDGNDTIKYIVKTERTLRLVLLVRGVPARQNAHNWAHFIANYRRYYISPFRIFLTDRKGAFEAKK